MNDEILIQTPFASSVLVNCSTFLHRGALGIEHGVKRCRTRAGTHNGTDPDLRNVIGRDGYLDQSRT